MLETLKGKKKTIGLKQSLKAVKANRAARVLLAQDSDLHIIDTVEKVCKDNSVEVILLPSMAEMGKACEIDVPAAVVAILAD
jgi:large subunit ribosomal protein L7A